MDLDQLLQEAHRDWQARQRAAAGFPIHERCGCAAAVTPPDRQVLFHRRGGDGCRAGRPRNDSEETP